VGAPLLEGVGAPEGDDCGVLVGDDEGEGASVREGVGVGAPAEALPTGVGDAQSDAAPVADRDAEP
jgi:hypothetical protein